jgi:hypothetical protein
MRVNSDFVHPGGFNSTIPAFHWLVRIWFHRRYMSRKGWLHRNSVGLVLREHQSPAIERFESSSTGVPFDPPLTGWQFGVSNDRNLRVRNYLAIY